MIKIREEKPSDQAAIRQINEDNGWNAFGMQGDNAMAHRFVDLGESGEKVYLYDEDQKKVR